jgi:Dolichyl-phosphate-mannose-protein mannosyltransferase
MIEELKSEVASQRTITQEPLVRPSLSERLEAKPGRYLLLFTAIYLFAEYCGNRHRQFWLDEIFTYNLADLPSIRDIWPMIRQGIELNPPLPFWITWVVHHTLGRGEFVTRLPSTLGFWGMCVCLFYYVRRRSDATHGFIALLLPLFTYTALQGTMARGYGLLLGFSAAALLSWQIASDNVRRKLAVSTLALSLAGAVSCHYYGLYAAGAIAVAELLRSQNRRRIDLPILAAILVGISPLVAYTPLIEAVLAGSKTFWVTPSTDFLFQSYADLFGPAAIVLLLFLVCALRVPRGERNWPPQTLAVHEVAACLVFAAMPFAVFVAALFGPIAFYTRYVQPVVIGFSIAVSMFLYRVGGRNRSFRNLSISLVVWLCFAPWTFWHMLNYLRKEPWSVIQAGLHLPEGQSLPIVIDNDDQFVIANHYAPKELQDHLFYLYDPQSAIKYTGADTSQRSLFIGQTFHDFHLVKYDDFVHQNPEFLVVKPTAYSWILQRLLEDGADVRLVQLNKPRGVFVQDCLLFRVKVSPGRAASK